MSNIISEMVELVRDLPAGQFKQNVRTLFAALDAMSDEEIIRHIEVGGIIPESYSSAQEKMWAKYCDYLLSRALSILGYKSEVLEARANAADVRADCGSHSLVGDAKAFRLSRTAKNQKDFKVEALYQWKTHSDYAVLVAPLYQYPRCHSQIYGQATRYGVVLFSFTHLGFLLRKQASVAEMDKVWEIPAKLNTDQSAIYWRSIDEAVLECCGGSASEWATYKSQCEHLVNSLVAEQSSHWRTIDARIDTMPEAEVRKHLKVAMGIPSKISMFEDFRVSFDINIDS